MRHKLFALLLVFPVVLIVSGPLAAHHGPASFDTTREVIVKGTVTEWIWANPHCFLKFDVRDEGGALQPWAVEVSNPTDMTRRGWARTSLKPGDQVSVTLQPARNGAPVGRLRSVVLPTGQTLSALTSTPAGATPPR